MYIQIKNRYMGSGVLFTVKAESVLTALETMLARGISFEDADLKDACLQRANLQGANLRGCCLARADLWRADLRGADLRGADLWDSKLRHVNFQGANLQGANLGRANLWNADLRGADLRGADLRDANLGGTDLKDAKIHDGDRLETGETFAEYLRDVVPSLCTAKGKSLEEVSAAWDRHDWWEGCPMAVAFGVHEPSQVPLLYRARVEQFVRMFDAGLIPNPMGGDVQLLPPTPSIEGGTK